MTAERRPERKRLPARREGEPLREGSFLHELVKGSRTKFLNTTTHSVDGIQIPYQTDDAIKDTLRETSLPPTTIFSLITKDTVLKPAEFSKGNAMSEMFETEKSWEGFIQGINKRIVSYEMFYGPNYQDAFVLRRLHAEADKREAEIGNL